MADNYEEEKYMYQITVVTGIRGNSGTGSNISFLLSGEDDDTGARRLYDGFRRVSYFLPVYDKEKSTLTNNSKKINHVLIRLQNMNAFFGFDRQRPSNQQKWIAFELLDFEFDHLCYFFTVPYFRKRCPLLDDRTWALGAFELPENLA